MFLLLIVQIILASESNSKVKTHPDYLLADYLIKENEELKLKLNETLKNHGLLKSYINSREVQNNEFEKKIAIYEENKKLFENKINNHIENEKIQIKKLHEMKIEIAKTESLAQEKIEEKDTQLSKLSLIH